MKKIPFNVSARTARLIGRENVSSAEGALIELVKNSYDADATFCIVYFEDEYAELLEEISVEAYNDYLKFLKGIKLSFLKQFYEIDRDANVYKFQRIRYEEELDADERIDIEKSFYQTVKINILDDGHGMTESTIEKSWMTIGTDAKHIEFLSSETGRVKSGAKGIGRFALDRLGETCELRTRAKISRSTSLWSVNWADFDQLGATINGISATLGRSPISIRENRDRLIEEHSRFPVAFKKVSSGTHIKIAAVRDPWRRRDIHRIYNELESLVPPIEAGDFKIYVLSKRYGDDLGEVLPNICNDFDYKLSANMDGSGSIEFTITRNEIDPSRLDKSLLARKFFENSKYSVPKITGKQFRYRKTLYELLPGLGSTNEKAHSEIGPFDFTFYFLKRTTDKKDAEVFLHRGFNSELRKRWLDHNNGIRIFRDNFRVRPYGEIGKAAWDWLGLGRRQAEDPSALRSGRWKVTPSNVSGIINISRINNLGLQDKSSREGIQENSTFELFRTVIQAIIKEFEIDRSSLYKEIYSHYHERKQTPTDEELNPKQEEDAEKIAQKIFENIKQENTDVKDDSSKLALALLKEKARSRESGDRLEEMKKENSLLRVFASSGITIASFTHELDSLNAKLGNRFDKLESLIRKYAELSVDDRLSVPDYLNPYRRISILRRDDERVKNWIKYSLRTIRKDKRKRTKINLKTYLENLCSEWSSTLAERHVTIKLDSINQDLYLRAYEIDLDCIFNNLIINSADAFKRPGFSGIRNISISANSLGRVLRINYGDSGPGLSPDIADPRDIFKPTFTTKKNNLGQEIGTGLGMWLIEKTIDEYGGKAKLGRGKGFSLTMELKSE